MKCPVNSGIVFHKQCVQINIFTNTNAQLHKVALAQGCIYAVHSNAWDTMHTLTAGTVGGRSRSVTKSTVAL